MVVILDDSVKVYQESIVPAIKLKITEPGTDDIITLKISGVVFSDDWKYISSLTELPSSASLFRQNG